ncbi:MAG: hypothetical protein U9R69_00785 [Thermodesulfobacteriota bacterium]|nr:hypothetical protein [Thermodesulfobacteriota bacterium]
MQKLLFCLAILLLSTPVTAQSSNLWETQLPFKEATISYQMTGVQAGSSTTYVKNFGKTSAIYRDTTITIMGITNRENSLTITTSDWVYDLDLSTRTGSKQVNPEKLFVTEFNNLSAADQKKFTANAEKLGMSTLAGMDGEIEKNAAKILGYNCDKVQMMGVTVYSISDTGLMLKAETDMMGMKFTEVATKIKKGSIPAAKFAVPADIQVSRNPAADEMSITHVKMTIQSILEGELPGARMEQYNPSPEEQDQPQEMPEDMQKQMEQMMKMFGNQG